MEDLIKALQILIKYGNQKYPTYCEHDVLNIVGIDASAISDEDIAELDKLHFIIDTEAGEIYSFFYGSA
jgi:hypothetical protein